MARQESDREDLMEEAVSLIRRIECESAIHRERLVIGLNSLEWLFVYIGNDLMYRFDESGRLRRAFVDGLLFRTAGGTLASLKRCRTTPAGEADATPVTTLVRKDLSPEELESFRQKTFRELTLVAESVRNGTVTRQFPAEATGIVDEIQQRISQVLDSKEFLAPAIVRR